MDTKLMTKLPKRLSGETTCVLISFHTHDERDLQVQIFVAPSFSKAKHTYVCWRLAKEIRKCFESWNLLTRVIEIASNLWSYSSPLRIPDEAEHQIPKIHIEPLGVNHFQLNGWNIKVIMKEVLKRWMTCQTLVDEDDPAVHVAQA